MIRWWSIRTRLTLSHLFVVLAGTATVLVVGRAVAPAFFRSHMASMSMVSGPMGVGMTGQLEDAFARAFAGALGVAVAVSVGVALASSYFSSRTLIRPIDAVRAATRRIASGHLSERLDEPREVELAALARDVNHLADQLEQTERRRRHMINEVSHELRHPIATIEGYLEGMLDGVLEPEPEILASMAAEAARLGRLAADLSLVSRTEEGSVELRKTAVSVGDVVLGVCDRLRPQFDDERVTLSVTRGPDLTIEADRDRLVQIVTNLVGNALTYTPEGRRVSVAWSSDRQFARIQVSDDGVGIRPEDIDRIFERFFRADRGAPGGTGIGLTIARGLARLHGGDVTVRSEGLGRGATFEIKLPLSDWVSKG